MPRFGRLILGVSAAALLGTGARASTAWPETGRALAPTDIEALRARGLESFVGPDGRARFAIDDQHFFQDEVRFSGFSARRWTNGRLIYQFNNSVSQLNRQRFLAACAHWTRVANVRCVPRTNESIYLVVQSSASTNSSDVGMPRQGRAYMKVVNWNREYIIAHEIGHALGLTHEQCRTGRDEFVEILEQNWAPGTRRINFDEHRTENLSPYDFESVMHYDDLAFGRRVRGGRLMTIRVRPPNERFQTIIGQRARLSAGDAQGMAARYGQPVP